MSQADVQNLVGQLKIAIQNRSISVATIIPIVIQAVEIAEQIVVEGYQKKDIVIQAMDCVINDVVADTVLAKFIKGLVPSTIDEVIAVSKGMYNINKSKKCCFFS